MRALLLILIGGGLLWVLIQGFGPSLAKDSGQAGSTGTMLREEPSGSSVPAATEPEVPTPAAAPAAAKPEPVAARPEPKPVEPVKEPSSAAPASATGGPAEVEIAARLVHQTSGFVEWIASAGGGLSAGRRTLARALALQLDGRASEAAVLVHELGGASDLGPDERKLLEFWPQGPNFALPPAGSASASLLLRAAALASAERTAIAAAEGSRWSEAADCFSRLLQEELRSPWEPDPACMSRWAEGLTQAQRGYHWNRKGSWSALELKVASGDSLIALRKRALQERPELVTCTGLIARANQLQGETIQPGQVLRVPIGKPHVLVDLGARWLFFMLDDEVVAAWPVGVGKQGSETPAGRYKVGEKSTDPTWFRPGQQPVPPGDPSNPLGTRWIAWLSETGEPTHLGFHGTRDPESIGQDHSEGCIRMLNRNVEDLYEILPRNSEILVRP